jgi:hypothetical protein
MFLDATPNEVYADGRLKTEPTENGVQLIAYNQHILAEVNRAADEITLFTGHYGQQSQSVSRYVHFLGKLLNERENFAVTVIGERAPNVSNSWVPDSAQYIGAYISGYDNMSAVERQAYNTVNDALRRTL